MYKTNFKIITKTPSHERDDELPHSSTSYNTSFVIKGINTISAI